MHLTAVVRDFQRKELRRGNFLALVEPRTPNGFLHHRRSGVSGYCFYFWHVKLYPYNGRNKTHAHDSQMVILPTITRTIITRVHITRIHITSHRHGFFTCFIYFEVMLSALLATNNMLFDHYLSSSYTILSELYTKPVHTIVCIN